MGGWVLRNGWLVKPASLVGGVEWTESLTASQDPCPTPSQFFSC